MSAPIVVSRRSFLVGLNLALGGLALGIYPSLADAAGPATGLAPHVLVHIAPDGLTTIVCHRSEMGQGIRSTLPALIARELGASIDRVVVQQAIGHPKYGDQNTDGSTSIRKQLDELRRAGATARQMLIAVAAWSATSPSTVPPTRIMRRRRATSLPRQTVAAPAMPRTSSATYQTT